LCSFAVALEAEHGGWRADFDWEDVPDVERDYVGGDEIHVGAGVDGASFAGGVSGAGFVSLGAQALGAFDLNAPEALSVVEDEVVAEAVAPGLGDAESEGGGAVEEVGFGALSGDFGICAGLGSDCVGRGSWWALLSPFSFASRSESKSGSKSPLLAQRTREKWGTHESPVCVG
jgi:hypothetical protein